METKHTPGEWKVGTPYENRYIQHIPIMSDIGNKVAITWPLDLKVTDEDYANAKLIAAAPDLLAALIKLRNEVKEVPEMNSRKYDLLGIEVNNAINKATI